ncbi:hypothetical protein KL910_004943 [Ogataea haglerorum]|nr:hypothetical protein KL945_004328 [Ogataea haglerorum]KAG7785109.1 hypothetical protein KL910_004943 [Ogataea haglerorum]
MAPDIVETNAAGSSASFSMDRIRLEAIESRRQECTKAINERKRKLAELYCVSRLPLLPISNDQVLQIEDKLMSFLEKNDLENGHEFNIAILSHENQQRRLSPPQNQILTETSEVKEPAAKRQKVDAQVSHREVAPVDAQKKMQGVPLATRQPQPGSSLQEGSLQSLIHSYEQVQPPRRSDEKSKRDLDYEDLSLDQLMIMLMPELKPHKVPEARSLTELYYHQQTLQLPKLLLRAHKSLTTDSYETALVEGKISVLYSRMEELKRKHSWSLRQPKKFLDPFLATGKKTHWDYLLSEMKWLATDFKQERRFKMVQCYYIAQAVKEYWKYGKVCCVRRKQARLLSDKEIEERNLSKELAPLNGSETTEVSEKVEEEPVELAQNTENKADNAANTQIESVTVKPESEENAKTQESEINVEMTKEVIVHGSIESVSNTETLLEEQPTVDPSHLLSFNDTAYPSKEYEEVKRHQEEIQPFKMYADFDLFNKTETTVIESLSSYVPFRQTEKDHLIERYEYGHISSMLPPADEEPDWEKIVLKKKKETEKHSVPYQKGLFSPAYRRFNILKPPAPPSIKNLELRIPTIWLPQDDKYLIRYVTDFSFNWNIISAHLSAKPTRSYTSNIERRTPWQCFERYIQLNDKFQFSDMRGLYPMAAKEWLEAAHKVQISTKRRISPLGVGIESIQRGHRRLRWGSMFDAMRKLMKKRENVQKPPQQPRKNNSEEKRTDTPTPEQLSKLKFERDRAIQEAYAQGSGNGNFTKLRVPPNAHQLATGAGKSPFSADGQANAGSSAAAQATMNGRRQFSNKMAPQASASPEAQQAQMRASSPQVYQQQVNQGGLQMPTGPGGAPLPEQVQQLMIQRQRQMMQQQQQQANNSRQSSRPPSSSMSSPVSTPTPQQVLQTAGNAGSPSQAYSQVQLQPGQSPEQMPQMNIAPSQGYPVQHMGSNAPSPQDMHANAQLSQQPRPVSRVNFTTSQVSAIINQIQTQNPNLPKEQVTRLAVAYLANYQQNQNRVADQTGQQPGKQPLAPSNGGAIAGQLNTPTKQGQPSQGTPPAQAGQPLTPQQLAMFANNPNLTPQQRKQIQVLRQHQLQHHQRRQQHVQPPGDPQSPVPATPQPVQSAPSNAKKLNSSAITTRFSPQPGTNVVPVVNQQSPSVPSSANNSFVSSPTMKNMR